MDRQNAARHIAKVFAYIAVGSPDKARQHAQLLIEWLRTV